MNSVNSDDLYNDMFSLLCKVTLSPYPENSFFGVGALYRANNTSDVNTPSHTRPLPGQG